MYLSKTENHFNAEKVSQKCLFNFKSKRKTLHALTRNIDEKALATPNTGDDKRVNLTKFKLSTPDWSGMFCTRNAVQRLNGAETREKIYVKTYCSFQSRAWAFRVQAEQTPVGQRKSKNPLPWYFCYGHSMRCSLLPTCFWGSIAPLVKKCEFLQNMKLMQFAGCCSIYRWNTALVSRKIGLIGVEISFEGWEIYNSRGNSLLDV